MFAFVSSACKSSPLNLGSLTSRTRQQGAAGSFRARNSAAVPNNSTVNPTERMRLLIESRTAASSSTTKTTARGLGESIFIRTDPFGREGYSEHRDHKAGQTRPRGGRRD